MQTGFFVHEITAAFSCPRRMCGLLGEAGFSVLSRGEFWFNA
jgi:hypothetical protein